MTDVTGVILAGGLSIRMGEDKVLITLHGKRLIDYAYDALEPISTRVVAATRGRWVPGLYTEEIEDAEGEGPLAGIVGALRAATTPLIAVVAADMPFASTDVLRRLIDAWDGEPAVVPIAAGMLQPLHAIYATAATDRFAQALHDGERSPRRAVEKLGGAVVDAGVYDPGGTAGEFWRSVNAPEELAALEALPPPS